MGAWAPSVHRKALGCGVQNNSDNPVADSPAARASGGHAHSGMSACPRVALLAPGELFGGAERQILALVAELRSRGVILHVALFHDGELARRLRGSGVEPAILNSTLDVAWSWMPALRRASGDVVFHVHGYRAMAAVAIGSLTGRIRVVKTEHGLLESPGSLSGRLRTRVYYLVDQLSTWLVRAKVVYVTSDLLRRAPILTRGLSATVIHNGIEELHSADHARPVEMPGETRNVAWVGRVEPVKRPELALSVMRGVRTAPIVLHIVGDGELSGAIREATTDLTLRDKVRVHGFRKDARSFVAHADAVLITSDHEGLPYVVLEAMALRVPIVATAVGGISEVLQDGRSALLFAPGDAAQGALQLDRILEDKELRRRIVDDAFAIFRERLSSSAMCDAYVRLYGSW